MRARAHCLMIGVNNLLSVFGLNEFGQLERSAGSASGEPPVQSAAQPSQVARAIQMAVDLITSAHHSGAQAQQQGLRTVRCPQASPLRRDHRLQVQLRQGLRTVTCLQVSPAELQRDYRLQAQLQQVRRKVTCLLASRLRRQTCLVLVLLNFRTKTLQRSHSL